MWSSTKTRRLALASAPLLLALAACGSGGTAASSGTAPKTSPVAASSGVRVATTSLGRVLVDGKGMTVYRLSSDHPGTSTCVSSCLAYWPAVPPLRKGAKPTGVTGQVSSTTTPTGQRIVTVGGWPLYTYVLDKAPGDVTGEGVTSNGGTWYAVSPSGQSVQTTSTTGPSSGGRY